MQYEGVNSHCIAEYATAPLRILPAFFMNHKNHGLGELAEWLRSGLQIRVYEFDSHTRLH
jgi:phage tail protein X